MVDIHGCKCVYCGAELQTDDHTNKETYVEIDRISSACLYNIANVIPACRKCNASRSDRPMVTTARNLTLAIEAVELAMSVDHNSFGKLRSSRKTVLGKASTTAERIAAMRIRQEQELDMLRAMLPV